MTSNKLTIVPIILLYVAELPQKLNYNPMKNPWCTDCPGHGEGKPCQKDKAPFTSEEITEAINNKDFEPIRNECWGYDNTYNTHGIKNETCAIVRGMFAVSLT